MDASTSPVPVMHSCLHCRSVCTELEGGKLPRGWRRHLGFDFSDPQRRTFPVYVCSAACEVAAQAHTERFYAQANIGGGS